jgi:hypothetical protein
VRRQIEPAKMADRERHQDAASNIPVPQARAATRRIVDVGTPHH